ITSPWRCPHDNYVATFRGSEFFCYDVSRSPVQSSADELALAFRTRQRHGLLLHTGRAADFLNLSLKAGAVWLVINLGAGAFEALVEPVNGKFHDGGWHHVRVTRNLRQVRRGEGGRGGVGGLSRGQCRQLPNWELWELWAAPQLGMMVGLGSSPTGSDGLINSPTGSTGSFGQLPIWEHWERWVAWAAPQLGALGAFGKSSSGSDGWFDQLPNWEHWERGVV
uniref:Laminin G domain-containing protein n=1 Tax=Junco hyemalis TaxID=40217 RepID=A0A8C5JEC3_JUNHY